MAAYNALVGACWVGAERLPVVPSGRVAPVASQAHEQIDERGDNHCCANETEGTWFTTDGLVEQNVRNGRKSHLPSPICQTTPQGSELIRFATAKTGHSQPQNRPLSGL
jgi:hypothetical protein